MRSAEPPPRHVQRRHRATGVEAPGRLRPLVNTLAVVRALLASAEPLSVIDLAGATGLPVHTVRRAVRALDGAGWPVTAEGVDVDGRPGGAPRMVYSLDLRRLAAARGRKRP